MESNEAAPRQSSSKRGLLLALLAAFVAGGGLVGWGVWYSLKSSGEPASLAADTAPPVPPPGAAISPSPSQSADNAAQAVKAVTRVAEQQGGLDQRLAAAEQRLARLDLQAQAAAGNAARAESLLIAFATRRAVERAIRALDAPIPQIMTILLALELAGRIERRGGNTLNLI